MKKKLNADAIANELHEGSVFFSQARRPAEPEPEEAAEDQLATVAADAPIRQSAGRPAGRSTGPMAGQSTTGPTAQAATAPFDTSVILGRPKAFYITERQDHELDVVVDKLSARLNGRGNQKIDRSTVVRLVLEMSDITADHTIDRLASHMVNRLVSQLMS